MRNVAVALVIAAMAMGCRTSGTDAKQDPSAPSTSTSKATTTNNANAQRRIVGTDPGGVGAGTELKAKPGNDLAAFAAGCFWGVEDNFRQVPGVVATAVGYTGGHTKNPNYETVCSHTTGHAETVLIEFDPTKVAYEDLVRVFFRNHDPTTKNRQGPDHGDQYRSHIFTLNDKQDAAAKTVMAKEQSRIGTKQIVTQVTHLGEFWKAEDYHQQYDEKTGTHSCPMPKGVHEGT